MPRDDFSSIYRMAVNEDYATTSRQIYLGFCARTGFAAQYSAYRWYCQSTDIARWRDPEPGQRDTPTDLLGAVKVTGGVGDLRYGLLAAMEDDIRWRGRDANNLAVDIEGAGRDFGRPFGVRRRRRIAKSPRLYGHICGRRPV